MRLCSILVAAALVWAPASALAGPDEPVAEAESPVQATIRAVVNAPAGCPGSTEIEAEIRARTPLARSEPSDQPDWTFGIRIEQADELFVATMTVQHVGEPSSERTLRGADCGSLASALALSAALALDPNALLVVEPEPAPDPAPEPEPEPKPKPPPPPAPRPEPPKAPPPAAEQPAAIDHRLGADLGAASLLAPRWMPYAGVFYERAWGSSDLFAPSLRGSLSTAFNFVDRYRDGDFVWVAAGIDVCPIRVAWPTKLELRPCLVGQAGVLWGRGAVAVEPDSALRPWLSAGASAHVSLWVTPRLALDLSAAALVPFLRHRFVVENRIPEIARTAPMLVLVGLGMSLALP